MAKQFQVNTASGGSLTTSLFSYYKMEDATDFYGGENGSATDVTFSSGNGKVNNGGGFNGSSSKIDLPTDATDLNPCSIAFWMKTADTTDEVLMQFDNAGDTANMYVRKNFTSANKLDFICYNGTSDTIATTVTSVTTDAWINVVITYSAAEAKIYINGNTTADVTNSSMNNITPGDDRRAFGYFRLAGILYYTGALDEIGIWTKVLSSNEITDLYNGGSGQTMVDVSGPANVSTYNGLSKNSTSAIKGLSLSSVRAWNGLQ